MRPIRPERFSFVIESRCPRREVSSSPAESTDARSSLGRTSSSRSRRARVATPAGAFVRDTPESVEVDRRRSVDPSRDEPPGWRWK